MTRGPTIPVHVNMRLAMERNQIQVAAGALGFGTLWLFALLRPLALTGAKVSFLGFSVLELFAMGISYVFIIWLVMSARYVNLNRTGGLIVLFCAYCILSLFWGSAIRQTAEVTLPFLLFIAVVTFVNGPRQVKRLMAAFMIGYLLPLFISTCNVALGRSVHAVEHWNQLERHAGAFSGSHTLAYAMFFFSYFFCIHRLLSPSLKRVPKIGLNAMLILSFYCLYKSHTRTALIGFIAFWSIYLFGSNRRLFYGMAVVAMGLAVVFHGEINALVWKSEERDINRATSGRVEMWEGNVELFKAADLPVKLLGHGLGWRRKGLAFHNDYLGLLMHIGILGLLFYGCLLASLGYDILRCPHKQMRYLFGALWVSVVVINFGSNAVISRFELSQYFWLTFGLFYVLNRRAGEKEIVNE